MFKRKPSDDPPGSQHIEPVALKSLLGLRRWMYSGTQTVAMLSIAVSLKRIADHLDRNGKRCELESRTVKKIPN
jgi:hypothetical protein